MPKTHRRPTHSKSLPKSQKSSEVPTLHITDSQGNELLCFLEQVVPLNDIEYVLLTIPRLSYDLFPIATVIGFMAALGILANTNELLIFRTSGLAKMQIA